MEVSERSGLSLATCGKLAVIHAYRQVSRRTLADRKVLAVAVTLCAAMQIGGWPYLRDSALSPLGANNIYTQQCRMRRFVVDCYRAPVAVNDQGFVSYRNGNYVLDLWGLGSRIDHDLRVSNDSPEWMTDLARRKGVKLAMLYTEWFGRVPDDWVLIGRLRLDGMLVTPSFRTVEFYSIDPAALADATAAVRRFRKSLSEKAGFVFCDEPG